jgi:membrane protease YdiL (CAAX protease family)
MKKQYLPPVAGLAAAIAITATMDAAGYSLFSALPLLPLAGLFWYLQGFSRPEIGLVRGPAAGWGLAVACPVLVLGAAGVAASLWGAIDTSATDWSKTLLNVSLMTLTGILMGILTEEGFFRGWLWASLRRAGTSEYGALVWTSLAFTAWHVSAITLDPDFSVPAAQVPVYLVNATLLGLTWGLLRLLSGSLVVASVAHAFWNGIDYPLYGFGVKVGALGIRETQIFGPEVGWLGIVFNLAAVAVLFALARRARVAP